MTRQEILNVLLEMRLCRNGLVQTPEQLRFSLFALTDAMSSMDFTSTVTPTNQMNGGVASKTDKTSNVISVDSSDEENEENEGQTNGKNNCKHTRKRSTADDESSMEKDDDAENNVDERSVDNNVEKKNGDKNGVNNSEVTRQNGESQAKRSKSETQDW